MDQIKEYAKEIRRLNEDAGRKVEEAVEKIDALNFLGTINANIDNKKMSDKEFRQFIRNTLPSIKGIPKVKTIKIGGKTHRTFGGGEY